MASSTAHPAPPGFVVEQVHPPQLLVLHSNSFVPAAWRGRLGGLIDFWWTWTFALADTARGAPACCGPWARTGPWWLSVAYLAALVRADDVPPGRRAGRRRPGRQQAGRRPPANRSPRRRRTTWPMVAASSPAAARPKGHRLDLLRRLLTTASWAG